MNTGQVIQSIINKSNKDSNIIPLTDKQIKYLAARIEGKSKKDAIIQAGYAETTNPTAIERQSDNLRKALLTCMESRGLTSDRLAQKIASGMEAKKIIITSHQGKIGDTLEVADNETQHKYVRTALEVRGDLERKDQGMSLNVGIVNMPGMSKTDEEWNGI